MMNRLVQTPESSIIFGDFRGEPNEELFRCPRQLDNVDLPDYVNEHRCMLGFEADEKTTDLRASDKYCGYFRMYFCDNRWFGRWMEINDKIDAFSRHGVFEIMEWIREIFPKGCEWSMIEYLKQFPEWGCKNRYLLRPLYSDHYLVMVDTTYWNEDYPVRIYVYE